MNPSEQSSPRQSGRCMEDTRVDLLATIKEWMQHSPMTDGTPTGHSDNIFWLTGLPGSGKSSVAGSVATMAVDLRLPLSSFFCKRGVPSLSSAARIFPTLSYALCDHDKAYREAILNLLRSRECDKLKEEDIGLQFELLFTKPFESRLNIGKATPHVVVVDALDECSDKNSKRAIAKHLALLGRIA